MEKPIRVRFAPSPTGYLHIGSLRTVLFTYLIAKSLGGKIILRIEDTDQKREVKGATDKLIAVLSDLGIEFDEGPHIGGNYGPYIQSERLSIYTKYKNELLEKGGAYHCFCSPERLEKMRSEQQTKNLPPRYDRKCRHLSKDEIETRISNGEKYVIRQKMPSEGFIIVHDELRGDIKFNAEDLDDQVLIKTNGVPTYHFASMVDDHLMETTFITRADEWLPSLPKNYLLFESFGWEAPKFIHYPVIINKNGKGKLSKRQGDVAVEDFLAKGYLKEALINFCALIGWHPKGDNEIFSLESLIAEFDYRKIGNNPAVFDTDKLDYFNGYYIRQKTPKEFTELCLPHLITAKIIQPQTDFSDKYTNLFTDQTITLSEIQNAVVLEQERLKKLSELPELIDFFFRDNLDYMPDLLVWKKMDKENVKPNLEKLVQVIKNISIDKWNKTNIEQTIIEYIKGHDLKIGEFLWPMRVALTGKEASPGPFEVAESLGQEKTIKRISEAITKIS